jgi:hypothetical protein
MSNLGIVLHLAALGAVQPAANTPVRETVGGPVLTIAGVCAALLG